MDGKSSEWLNLMESLLMTKRRDSVFKKMSMATDIFCLPIYSLIWRCDENLVLPLVRIFYKVDLVERSNSIGPNVIEATPTNSSSSS